MKNIRILTTCVFFIANGYSSVITPNVSEGSTQETTKDKIECKINKSAKIKYLKEYLQGRIVAKDLNSPIQLYLKRGDYKAIVSTPLILHGLGRNPPVKDVLKYSLKHELYFSFNLFNKVVSIAKTQKEADALSLKNREVFYAVAGENLKKTIGRWSKLTGYHLNYNADKDLIIISPATFFGKLDARDGPLNNLLNVLITADIHLKAQFYSNKVLVIKDNPYGALLLSGRGSHE